MHSAHSELGTEMMERGHMQSPDPELGPERLEQGKDQLKLGDGNKKEGNSSSER